MFTGCCWRCHWKFISQGEQSGGCGRGQEQQAPEKDEDTFTFSMDEEDQRCRQVELEVAGELSDYITAIPAL